VKIICISGKAQHGKDTCGEILKEYLERKGNRVLVTHYGDLLKYICKMFFAWDGQKDDLGRTLLQQVGTGIIRKAEPNYWINFIISVLNFFQNEWDFVLIPDTRFINEYENFCENGFDTTLLRVQRENFISPLSEEQQNHESETAFDDYRFDYIISAVDGDIVELKEQVMKFADIFYPNTVQDND